MKKVICRDVFNNSCQIDIDKLEFCSAIYGIIIENNKILLTKQWDGYSLPGGRIEIGETIQEAFERETKEETGLDIKMGEIIECENDFFKFKSKSGKENYFHTIVLYYTHKSLSGSLSKDMMTESEKTYLSGAEWIKINDLGKITFRHSCNLKKILSKINIK